MKAIKHIISAALCVIFMTACSDGLGISLNISSGSAETLEAPESSDGGSVLVSLTEEQIRLRKLNVAYSLFDNSVTLKNSTESGRILYIEETDTTFWTDNKYLYQKTGDENFALASGIIYSLNLLEGRLYFICSDAVAAVRPMSGEPFVLDLATGELSSLAERLTAAIYVQSERIFLKQHESYTDADGS